MSGSGFGITVLEEYKVTKGVFTLNQIMPNDNILKVKLQAGLCWLCDKPIDHFQETGCGHKIICHLCTNDIIITDNDLDYIIKKARELGAYSNHNNGIKQKIMRGLRLS